MTDYIGAASMGGGLVSKSQILVVSAAVIIGAILAPAILAIVWELGDGDSGF